MASILARNGLRKGKGDWYGEWYSRVVCLKGCEP